MAGWASLGTILAAWLAAILSVSAVSSFCNTSNVKVSEPEIKYLLNENISVTWTVAGQQLQNYSANYCCFRSKGSVGYCPGDCPKSVKINNCKVESNDLQLKRYSCSFVSQRYMNYSIFLTAFYHGCAVKSVYKKIMPSLVGAHPPGVPKLVVFSNSNGLEAEWQKPINILPRLCYFLTCHEMEGLKRVKKVDSRYNMTQNLKVCMPLDITSHAFKSYQCCIKVRICGPDYKIYSEELCNVTKTPEAAPSEAPKMLCGIRTKCPEVIKGNLRNVTVSWQLPDKSTWNGGSIKMEVIVRRTNDDDIKIFKLNGTATEVTLENLRIDEEYHVSVKMCTSVACGSISTPVILYSNTASKDGDIGPLNATLMAVISCSAIALMSFALVMCFIWDSRRNSARSRVGGLPPLQEPVARQPDQAWSGDSVATSIFVNSADYDFLYGNRRDKRSPCFTDSLSEEPQGDDYESSSLESYDCDSGRSLLTANTSRTLSPDEKRVMVTYRLTTTSPKTVSSLTAVDSDEDDPEFV